MNSPHEGNDCFLIRSLSISYHAIAADADAGKHFEMFSGVAGNTWRMLSSAINI